MKTKKAFCLASLVSFALVLLLGAGFPGRAAELTTINALAAWPKSAPVVEFFIKDFLEGLQKKADEKYPGQLKLVMKGGPEVVATNEQINAVQKGMVDLIYTSFSYYVSKMPELDVENISPLKPWEEKAVGLYAYWDTLHNQKTNTHFLVRNGTGLTFQIGLGKPIKSIDELKGMSIRVNPTTVAVIRALGANPVQMAPAEVYQALERNLVQGHVTPAFMLRTLGLDKVTKHLLFPGFFDTNNVIIVNLDKWKKLPKHLQDLITEHADGHARRMFAFNQDEEKKELAIYKAAGMGFIELPKPEADRFLKIANDAIMKVVMEKAPNESKKMLEYYSRKP
jgi:TRAP-type transport system periplasmic protein